MSDFIAEISAELTGTTNVPDAPDDDTALPNDLADAIESHDAINAERDARNSAEPPESHDEGGKPPANQQPRKQVPLAALQEERQRRQELVADLNREREQNAAMRQQFEQMLAQAQAQQQAQEIPAFVDDPEGHIKGLSQQFEQRLAAQQQQLDMRQYQDNVRQQLTAIAPAVLGAEDAMRAEVGEQAYQEAHAIVDQHVLNQLRVRHPNASEQELLQARNVEAFGFFKGCVDRGIDPARRIFEVAQRLGYTPGARVPHAPSGELPRVARVPGNTSLNSVSGAQTPDDTGKLTTAKVTAMSDAEFDQLCADMKAQSRSGPRV